MSSPIPDIDAEKLEEAIANAEDLTRFGRRNADSELILAAARAHLATLPRWEEIDYWRVECAKFSGDHWVSANYSHESEDDARTNGRQLAAYPDIFSCIHVTGPHKQRVPA